MIRSSISTSLVAVIVLLAGNQVIARELTLDRAVSIALDHTARGNMIRGNLEVAQQKYSARRINLYVPEISLNGSLPSYELNSSYRPFTNPYDKQLFEERNLDFQSFVQLKQSLFTGGTVTAQANLVKENNHYPDTRFEAGSGILINEDSRRGFLNLTFEQPLFRPSAVKNELNNRKDDLDIARMTKVDDEAGLRKEVTEAYLGVIQQTLQEEIAKNKFEKATLQVGIDSSKLADGVISEEDYLLSTAARLDAQLSLFDIQTTLEESRRELRTLLDLDVTEKLTLAEPPMPENLEKTESDRMVAAWETTVPVIEARHQYEKAKRAAEFEASGHGLTGDLNATYSLGRQRIIRDQLTEASPDASRANVRDNIKTSGWTVSLDFSLPVWDGGAGRADVRAAEYEAERAKYEYTRARRSARAQIINLVNKLDIGHQRLQIITKQIELGANRLDIAQNRYKDGQISQLTLLDAKVSYLESKDKYLEELKTYLLNRIDLQGKFAS